MKVIFVDFDGVLNSYQWFVKQDRDGDYKIDGFCPIACSNLQHILYEMPEVKLVISSSWRCGRTIDELKDILNDNGIEGSRIIGKTPDLNGTIRGKEIEAWLTEHPEVTKFVIIDDDQDMGILKKYLVKTNGYEGLMWSKMKKVMEILGHEFK